MFWLTKRLSPEFNMIADFQVRNAPATGTTYRQFVVLCRKRGLLADATGVVDGSDFKAMNNHAENRTRYKLGKRTVGCNVHALVETTRELARRDGAALAAPPIHKVRPDSGTHRKTWVQGRR
jgi:hypothetical protein